MDQIQHRWAVSRAGFDSMGTRIPRSLRFVAGFASETRRRSHGNSERTTPTDLEARLRAHGAHEDEAEPDHTAMVLETEPPGIDEIEVRVVESYEDYVKSAEIMFIGFGGSFSGDEVAAMRAALPKRYADYQDQSATRRYLPLESLRSEVGQRFPRHAAAAPIALLSVLAGTLR